MKKSFFVPRPTECDSVLSFRPAVFLSRDVRNANDRTERNNNRNSRIDMNPISMTNPNRGRLVLTALLAGTTFFASGVTHAANLTWVGPLDGSGDITDADNWNTTGLDPVSEPAGDGDFLFFGYRGDPGLYPLTLNVPEENPLDLGFGGWRIGFRGEFDLEIIGGGTVSGSQTHLGRWDSDTDSFGTLTLTGPGTTWVNGGEQNSFIGISGGGAGAGAEAAGTLNINGGATYSHTSSGAFNLGYDDGREGTYTGTININGSGNTLSVTDENANFSVGSSEVGSGSGEINLNGGLIDLNTTATVGDGATAAGVMNLGNGADASTFRAAAIQGGSGSSTVNFDTVTVEAVTADTDLISGLDTASVAEGGLSIDARGLSLLTSQDFTGTGAITLTNSEVDPATLAFSGSHTAGLSVQENVTLLGGFSLGGQLSVAENAAFGPGNSLGTVDVDSAVIEGMFQVEFDGSGSDLLNVANDLDIAGATLSLVELGSLAEDVVFASYGTLTGTFADVQGLQSGWSIDYSYLGGDDIALVIPEPGTYALVGGFAALVLVLIRRSLRTHRAGSPTA